MDVQGAYTFLHALFTAYRMHFESAQQRFPAALIRMSRGDTFADIAGLRRFAGIKNDMLRAYDVLTHDNTADLIHLINTAPHYHDVHDTYSYDNIRTRYLLQSAIPRDLMVARENLRQRGYIMLGHAQNARRHEKTSFGKRIVKAAIGNGRIYSDSYLSHIEKVFENAKQISTLQARTLKLNSAYDANLADFSPDVSAARYHDILKTLFAKSVQARTQKLARQAATSPPISLPDFTPVQQKRLVDLICELLPIPDAAYETHMLTGLPSMCMGTIATIRANSNPLTLLETTFHERIAHLTYRYNADASGGINGFHMDEARALSMERFFLREQGVAPYLSDLLQRAYGHAHDSFAPDNIHAHTHWVFEDISDRTASDDLTYIIQETIRGRCELRVMNGDLDVQDMPDFLASETEAAFGLSGLNGYHIMRETFQWPLAMIGHVSAYPLGLVMGAQLHNAALKTCGPDFADITRGADSPYFKFMAIQVDAAGTTKSPASIIKQATGEDFLDMRPLDFLV